MNVIIVKSSRPADNFEIEFKKHGFSMTVLQGICTEIYDLDIFDGIIVTSPNTATILSSIFEEHEDILIQWKKKIFFVV
ncbi:hypothetical protein MXB_312, partial [Myxobolus squamalis]